MGDDVMDDNAGADALPMGNMLRCGCPLGRPCTCEMGVARRAADAALFVCGECVNCRLNATTAAKSMRRRNPATTATARRCLRYTELVTRQQFELLELGADCVLRMRQPDWNVDEKSAFFTRMRQLRLAMLEATAASNAVLETQREARNKLSCDLVNAKDVLQMFEEHKKSEPRNARRKAVDYTHVDSDAFDAFSKQLIPVKTLLPDLLARLETVNATITREEKNIEIVIQYVQDVAARKLQQTVRTYHRQQHWRSVRHAFELDVQLAAALTIQAASRMLVAKRHRASLAALRQSAHKQQAARTISRYFRCLCAVRRAAAARRDAQARRQAVERRLCGLRALERIVVLIACRDALLKWRDQQRAATAHQQLRTLHSAVTIQRMYRGYYVRMNLKRVRLLQTLSCRVRSLVDHYLRTGDLWGFVLEVDADYRRFEDAQQVEAEHAHTFVSTLLQQRKRDDDQLMHDWFTAAAIQSPIVQGVRDVQAAYADSSASPAASLTLSLPSSSSVASHSVASTASPATSELAPSWSHALLDAPLATDLVALSPLKRKTDVFPTDLPPKVIRHAIAAGYTLDDVIAVLRGLRAQRKDERDVALVLKTLAQRAPLMTTTWTPERIARHDAQPHYLVAAPARVSASQTTAAVSGSVGNNTAAPALQRLVKPTGATRSSPTSKARNSRRRRCRPNQPELFITDNLLASIPGGLNASIARIVLVAALQSFDPDANGGDGAFVIADDVTRDPFVSYLALESPLLKIRREHLVLEAAKPFIHTLTDHGCWTGMDVLYNVRGVDELVVWTLPRALAHSIYDVLKRVQTQQVRASRRTIARELFVSPSFERFFQARQSRQQAQDADADARSISQSTDSLKAEIRMRLETDVLLLPVQRVATLLATDVLFKAAFLVCETETLDDQHDDQHRRDDFDAFLDALVALQTDGDALALRTLVSERVAVAKQLADECAEALAAVGVCTASDLVTHAHVVDAQLDRALAAKVHELLASVAPAAQQCEPHAAATKIATVELTTAASARSLGRKSRASLLLDAQHVARTAAQLSPLVRQSRVAVHTPDDIDIPL